MSHGAELVVRRRLLAVPSLGTIASSSVIAGGGIRNKACRRSDGVGGPTRSDVLIEVKERLEALLTAFIANHTVQTVALTQIGG